MLGIGDSAGAGRACETAVFRITMDCFMPIRKTSHARYELWYHFAWSTKYRKKIWKDENKQALVKQLFRKIAGQYDMEIGTIQLLSDHVHLTLTAPPRIAPAKAVQILKSVSTKALLRYYPELKKEYWGGQIWVQGYFVRSVGPGLTKESIDRYIKEQAEEV